MPKQTNKSQDATPSTATVISKFTINPKTASGLFDNNKQIIDSFVSLEAFDLKDKSLAALTSKLLDRGGWSNSALVGLLIKRLLPREAFRSIIGAIKNDPDVCVKNLFAVSTGSNTLGIWRSYIAQVIFGLLPLTVEHFDGMLDLIKNWSPQETKYVLDGTTNIKSSSIPESYDLRKKAIALCARLELQLGDEVDDVEELQTPPPVRRAEEGAKQGPNSNVMEQVAPAPAPSRVAALLPITTLYPGMGEVQSKSNNQRVDNNQGGESDGQDCYTDTDDEGDSAEQMALRVAEAMGEKKRVDKINQLLQQKNGRTRLEEAKLDDIVEKQHQYVAYKNTKLACGDTIGSLIECLAVVEFGNNRHNQTFGMKAIVGLGEVLPAANPTLSKRIMAWVNEEVRYDKVKEQRLTNINIYVRDGPLAQKIEDVTNENPWENCKAPGSDTGAMLTHTLQVISKTNGAMGYNDDIRVGDDAAQTIKVSSESSRQGKENMRRLCERVVSIVIGGFKTGIRVSPEVRSVLNIIGEAFEITSTVEDARILQIAEGFETSCGMQLGPALEAAKCIAGGMVCFEQHCRVALLTTGDSREKLRQDWDKLTQPDALGTAAGLATLRRTHGAWMLFITVIALLLDKDFLTNQHNADPIQSDAANLGRGSLMLDRFESIVAFAMSLFKGTSSDYVLSFLKEWNKSSNGSLPDCADLEAENVGARVLAFYEFAGLNHLSLRRDENGISKTVRARYFEVCLTEGGEKAYSRSKTKEKRNSNENNNNQNTNRNTQNNNDHGKNNNQNRGGNKNKNNNNNNNRNNNKQQQRGQQQGGGRDNRNQARQNVIDVDAIDDREAGVIRNRSTSVGTVAAPRNFAESQPGTRAGSYAYTCKYHPYEGENAEAYKKTGGHISKQCRTREYRIYYKWVEGVPGRFIPDIARTNSARLREGLEELTFGQIKEAIAESRK